MIYNFRKLLYDHFLYKIMVTSGSVKIIQILEEPQQGTKPIATGRVLLLLLFSLVFLVEGNYYSF